MTDVVGRRIERKKARSSAPGLFYFVIRRFWIEPAMVLNTEVS